MDYRLLDLIATVMDACAGPPGRRRRGHPPAVTMRVLATLRQFLREGRPWRGLRATPEQASGSTLRRRLQARAGDLLRQAHAVLVAILRGQPDPASDPVQPQGVSPCRPRRCSGVGSGRRGGLP